ncbi:hypothetical protein D3C87_1810080 [compost metagenome]
MPDQVFGLLEAFHAIQLVNRFVEMLAVTVEKLVYKHKTLTQRNAARDVFNLYGYTSVRLVIRRFRQIYFKTTVQRIPFRA